MELSHTTIVALTTVAFVAGLIDAIAGGGGLLTVPALLTAGLPPHLVFGTNKGSAVFGSGAAFWRFSRAKLIDQRLIRWLFPLGFLGSVLGAWALVLLSPAVLKPLVLVLLLAAGGVVAFVRPREATGPRPAPSLVKVCALALGIGAYDGFFGPGTGTFLIIGFVILLHQSLQQASANAKVLSWRHSRRRTTRWRTTGRGRRWRPARWWRW